jgi:hypothetical protein
MTKVGLVFASLLLLFASGAHAQPEETRQNVVRAEAPIVAGNAVSAKKRALADAFRQATEQALGELLKQGEPMPGAAAQPVAQLKAALATNGQRFVRSYRLIEQQTEDGVLKVMVEIDVDSVLLRRELDHIRGAIALQTQPLPKATGNVLFVAGTAPAAAQVVAALPGQGVRVQLDPGPTEAHLLASAARQNSFALFVAAKNGAPERVRGTLRLAVKCGIGWRLFGPGAQATHGPAVERTEEDYGFATDESAARAACLGRAAGAVARGVASSMRTPVVGTPFLTLQLEIDDVGVIPVVLHALKRLGSVTASEVRHVTWNAAEIRVFTRSIGPVLFQALGRELGGKLLLTPTAPPADVVAVKVQGPDATVAAPEETR